MKEKVEDTKEVIRIRKLKKNTQYNGQKKKGKRTNKDLQNITQKTIDRVTRTPLKTRVELRCSGRIRSSCSTCFALNGPFIASHISGFVFDAIMQ